MINLATDSNEEFSGGGVLRGDGVVLGSEVLLLKESGHSVESPVNTWGNEPAQLERVQFGEKVFFRGSVENGIEPLLSVLAVHVNLGENLPQSVRKLFQGKFLGMVGVAGGLPSPGPVLVGGREDEEALGLQDPFYFLQKVMVICDVLNHLKDVP